MHYLRIGVSLPMFVQERVLSVLSLSLLPESFRLDLLGWFTSAESLDFDLALPLVSFGFFAVLRVFLSLRYSTAKSYSSWKVGLRGFRLLFLT